MTKAVSISPWAVIAAAVVAFAAPSARAAATPLTPAPGATVETSHPVFSWALPPSERSDSITIAERPAVTPEGRFFEEHVVTSDFFASSDAREWAPSEPLYAGIYWWSVSSSDRDTFAIQRSAPIAFSVAPMVDVSVRLSRSSSGRSISIEVATRTNVRDVAITAEVRRGGRVIWTARENERAFIDSASSTSFAWSAPRRIRKGLRLTLRVTGDAGDARSTATRRFRSP